MLGVTLLTGWHPLTHPACTHFQWLKKPGKRRVLDGLLFHRGSVPDHPMWLADARLPQGGDW